MPVLPRVRGFLRSLAGRGPVHRDLTDEVGGYFEMLVDEHLAKGMTPHEARRQARLEMGGLEQVKESVRAVRPAVWLDTFLRDVRHSVRLLRKTPGFSLTAIVVLALGIGANAAVFSLINILMFQPLAGEHQPGEVAGVYARDDTKPDSYRRFSYREFDELRREAGVFGHLAAYRSARVGVTDGGVSRFAKAALATGDFFTTLGVGLAAGRSFSRDEERPGSGAAVIVLSYTVWQNLGGSPDILGRTLIIDAHPFTVIGVAPKGFAGVLVFAGPEFWMPLGADSLLGGKSREAESRDAAAARLEQRNLLVVGRTTPGLSLEAAGAALHTLSRSLREASPLDASQTVLSVARLARTQDGQRPGDDREMVAPLGALTGSALILLILASLNVANMQLARGTSRRKEIAMRLALGAGRGRVVAQLLTEGLVLSLAAGAAGLAASVLTMSALIGSLATSIPDTLSTDLTPDWRVWLALLGFCSLAAVAFGLGPAWKLSRLDLLPEIKSPEGTRTGRGLRRFGSRNLLVAAQVSLSLALLAAAGLFVRGAFAADRADPGYRYDHQLLLRVDATLGGHDAVSGRHAYRRLLGRIRTMPGVESAALATFVAFGNNSMTRRVARPGEAPASGSPGIETQIYTVSASYFQTLGLSMLRGREFTPAEELDPSDSPVVVIDEPLAARLFPGQDPLGQFVQFGTSQTDPKPSPMLVVGIAPGLRHRLSDVEPVPHIYRPLGSHYDAHLYVHVRTAGDGRSGAGDLRPALGAAARAADTRLAVLSVQTLGEARDSMPMNWIVRTAGRTFGAFGAIALFMAAIGLYGVKAYVVSCRTREIGIRMALGARTTDVIRMVLQDGAALLLASIAVGFLLAIAVGQAVSSLLVGVQPFDPLVLSVATAVLAGAVLAACYIPARRATRVSPVTALRTE